MIRRLLLVVAVGLAGPAALGACGSGSSGKGCAKSVDALNASLAGTTSASDIDSAAVVASFKACDGPATWKLYAGVDHIGETIGTMGDMNDPTMSSQTALDFLCSRFDTSNSTDTCKGR